MALPASFIPDSQANTLPKSFVPDTQPTAPKPAQPGSVWDSILNTASTVTNFLGGKAIADTYGSELAKILHPELANDISASQPTPLQTVGSAIQLGSLFTPIGAEVKGISTAAKALGAGAKTASFLGKVGAGAGTGYAFDVGANLEQGKTGTQALAPGGATAIGGGLPLVGPVAKGIGRVAGESLGVSTGAGFGALKELFNAASQGGNASKTATQALRGEIQPSVIVDEAKNALDQIKSTRSSVYKEQLATLKGGTETYDITPIIDTVKKELSNFGVRPLANGELDFSRSPVRFDSKAQKDITDIVDTMKGFGAQKGDRTVIGLDSLKRAFQDKYSESSAVRSFVQSVSSSVKDILKQVPGYDEMASNYAEKSQLINDIQKSLSLGDKASIDTAFKKLTSVLRTNNEERKILVDELNAVSGGKLTPMIAGQQMSELLPRGLARQIEGFGALGSIMAGFGPAVLKMALFASPRVVGEMVRALGLGARASKYVLDALGADSAKFPGDYFAETNTGKAIGNYVKNIKPGLVIQDVSQKDGFKGFTDLSTKTLEKLKGRSTVSKTFIEDLSNQPDLKQAERDAIRNALKDEPATINVKDFANKVKSELLPLKATEPRNISEYRGAGGRYENITLPEELRGPVANYQERVYESPIKTSAGDVHFSAARGGTPENYFAHTRIEDLPDQVAMSRADRAARTKAMMAGDYSQGGVPALGKNQGGTRRVIELQSDLFQKGRLESEVINAGQGRMAGLHDADDIIQRELTPEQFQEFRYGKVGLTSEAKSKYLNSIRPGLADKIKAETEALANDAIAKRKAETSKLEPYRNTWHERVIREEVKQAAKDGKTKLQFPTGETAMKIEGLGNAESFEFAPTGENPRGAGRVTAQNMNVGDAIYSGDVHNGNNEWIITDVLGDGKFKAVPKDSGDFLPAGDGMEMQQFDANGNELSVPVPEHMKETFDISGKIDTENPIYKFYEKEVGKYLKNKYNAQLITDPQGVKWWEVNIKPEMKKLPIEAFGAGALLTGEQPKKDKNKR